MSAIAKAALYGELYAACTVGDSHVVEKLLLGSSSLDVNYKFTHGDESDKDDETEIDDESVGADSAECQTPLYMSASYGHLECVQLLLMHKADANLAGEDGITPLSISSQEGYLAVAQELLKAKADPNLADDEGTTPLVIAAQENKLEVVRLLVEQSASVDVQCEGHTALFMAAQEGYIEVC
jgi:ankyrin repeat protein